MPLTQSRGDLITNNILRTGRDLPLSFIWQFRQNRQGHGVHPRKPKPFLA